MKDLQPSAERKKNIMSFFVGLNCYPISSPWKPDPKHWIIQCCGSMTFWCGSGSRSADPCLWLINPDPTIYIIFQSQKVKKMSQNCRNQGFSYCFCLMIERSGSRAGAGSIPLTKDPDPGGPKTCGSGSAILSPISNNRNSSWKIYSLPEKRKKTWNSSFFVDLNSEFVLVPYPIRSSC